MSLGFVNSITYDIMHRCFAHPSDEVLHKAVTHCKGFPTDKVRFPREAPICPACIGGKMTSRPFPANKHVRAIRPFERMHSDLKEFPIRSYHKNKWFLSGIDEFTSWAWVVPIDSKAKAFNVIKGIYGLIQTRFNAHVEEWKFDEGGEFMSKALDTFLKEKGTQLRYSTPHTPQQNGHAERFNRTIMEKAQAMQIEACLPESWSSGKTEFENVHLVAMRSNN